jgi:hypothetical protein|tara:strand:+ start:558 stop:926 length:369 start_codon:yes stop_codon:yes gene_type:complete
LDISNNRLTGPIPNRWPVDVRTLILHTNCLSGNIPGDLSKYASLRTLKLQSNTLDGTIPQLWGKEFEELLVLDVSRNLLFGEIPSALAQAPKLKQLIVHNNQLTGETPAGILNKNLTLTFVR